MSIIHNPHNVTTTEFSQFKISGEPKPCSACGPCNPDQPSAPVVIAGQHYCFWCALEIARELCTDVKAQ